MANRRDRPKNPTLRSWLVKFRSQEKPIEVEAEYRGAARYYAKCVSMDQRHSYNRDLFKDIEWVRLKRNG